MNIKLSNHFDYYFEVVGFFHKVYMILSCYTYIIHAIFIEKGIFLTL